MAKKLKRFCVLCGKHADELVEGLCMSCYDKKFPKIKLEKDSVGIKICECGRAKIDGKWVEFSDEKKLVEAVIEKNVRLREDAEIYAEFKELENRIVVELFDVESNELIGSFVINVEHGKCKICSAFSGRYYEATLQIRGGKEFISDVLKIVEDVLNKEKHDEKAFVVESEAVRGGIDLKLGSKRAAAKIASLAKKYKNAEIKYSKKLKTRKKGKDIFRYTFLIKEVNHEKGKRRRNTDD